MADLPISGLPPVATPLANDEFASNQGGNSAKQTRQQLLALPSLDLSMSGTPFSTGTIGQLLNATAVIVATTFDSVEIQQTQIVNGTQWRIDATGGAVTVTPGAGVTLEYYNGSSVVAGAKVLAVGVSGILTKISNSLYRITTNESSGGGGSPGLEIIQKIDTTLSSGGTFTSDNFDVDEGDVIIFDITFTKPNGDTLGLDFSLGGSLSVSNVSLSTTNLNEYGTIKGSLVVRTGDEYIFTTSLEAIDPPNTVDRAFDADSNTWPGGGPISTNIEIEEVIFSDDYELVGYIARVL